MAVKFENRVEIQNLNDSVRRSKRKRESNAHEILRENYWIMIK